MADNGLSSGGTAGFCPVAISIFDLASWLGSRGRLAGHLSFRFKSSRIATSFVRRLADIFRAIANSTNFIGVHVGLSRSARTNSTRTAC
jgi:hypothetical protein